jgi:hypothetical protein
MNILKRELSMPPEELTPVGVKDFEKAFEENFDTLAKAKQRWSTLRSGMENGYAINEEEFARATEDLDVAMESMGKLRGISSEVKNPSPEAKSSSIPPRSPDDLPEVAAPAAPEDPVTPEQPDDGFDVEFEQPLPSDVEQQAELTLDEIEQRWREARQAAHVEPQGRPLEEAALQAERQEHVAYWERERDELLARTKATEHRKEADRLEMRIAEKRAQLEVTDAEANYDGYVKLEGEIRAMESERRQLLKPGIARKMKNAVSRIFEKASFNAKERWREVPEPVKNGLTLGGWFVYQTEKLRRTTRESGEDLQQGFKEIAEERNMSPMAAQEEANMMQNILKQEGHAEPSPGDYDLIDRLITRRKREENENKEKEIVAKVINDIKKKAGDASWLATYGITDAGTLTNSENLKRMEEDIRHSVRQLRDGQVRRDMFEYTKIIRRNLNPTWWRRAVYWGVERAIMGLKGK